jgi:hypothetical protein
MSPILSFELYTRSCKKCKKFFKTQYRYASICSKCKLPSKCKVTLKEKQKMQKDVDKLLKKEKKVYEKTMRK